MSYASKISLYRLFDSLSTPEKYISRGTKFDFAWYFFFVGGNLQLLKGKVRVSVKVRVRVRVRFFFFFSILENFSHQSSKKVQKIWRKCGVPREIEFGTTRNISP